MHARQLKAKVQRIHQRKAKADSAQLRGLEGQIATVYFQALSTTLPPTYQFEKRSRYPAQDRFNAILNYLYGMLYHLTETALITAGLDPYLPVFHSDKRNKPGLVYDIVEAFRPWADWVAVQLCQQRRIPKTMTQPHKGGIWLNEKGRKKVIENFQKHINRKVIYQEKKQKRHQVIKLFCREFAKKLQNQNWLKP